MGVARLSSDDLGVGALEVSDDEVVTLTVLAIAPIQAPHAERWNCCRSGAPGTESSSAVSDDPPEAATRTPEQPTTVVGGGGTDQALAISRALWQTSLTD